MNKTILLEKIKQLSNEIAFNYWKYYNNFILEDLYNKDIYNSIIDWYWNSYKNLKQLKKYYIKNKLEMIDWIKNNSNILEFQKNASKIINNMIF